MPCFTRLCYSLNYQRAVSRRMSAMECFDTSFSRNKTHQQRCFMSLYSLRRQRAVSRRVPAVECSMPPALAQPLAAMFHELRLPSTLLLAQTLAVSQHNLHTKYQQWHSQTSTKCPLSLRIQTRMYTSFTSNAKLKYQNLKYHYDCSCNHSFLAWSNRSRSHVSRSG